MTFLNPFVLFGLAAAAIPLVLHLLNIRRLRTIEFSTLTFLKELQKSQMRRVKLRQWLLLILRTLIVIFVVMAFSRPALRGTFAGLGTHAKTTAVIILDNTFSMSLRNDRGVFLRQAQNSALGLVDLLGEGDDAIFIRLSDLPAATIAEPTHDFQLLRESIGQSEVSYKRHTVEEALLLSSKLLGRSRNFNKEIYIFTDGQRTTVENGARSGEASNERLFEPGVRVFYVPFSSEAFENIGIVNVEVGPALFQTGKPFSLRAAVRNFGSTEANNHLVNLFLDGARVMQKSVTLPPRSEKTVEFTAIPQHTGIVRGRVELEDDAFDEDNSRYFTLLVPERINVLLSSSDPKSSSYLKLALSVASQESTGTLVRLAEVPPQQLTYAPLSRADVVILSNVASLSRTQAEELAQFSAQGGGIILFPGDLVEVSSYNSLLLPDLHVPSLLPTQILPPVGPGMSFDKIDYDHPIFQGMFESTAGLKSGKKEIESPRIAHAIRFASGGELRSIITLSDGTPFLWERLHEGGSPKENRRTILGFAVAANTSWSDFPLKGLFVPLIYQTILYAASGKSAHFAAQPAIVGEKLEIPLEAVSSTESRGGSPSRVLRLLDPEGREIRVPERSPEGPGASPNPILTYDNATVPGIYTVVRGRDTLTAVPVNVDPAESDGGLSDLSQVVAMGNKYGIEKNQIVDVSSPGSLSTTVLQSRYGVELWKYFLAGALILALLEMIIAREPKQEAS
ncbi:MAG TPA: BatA domain-containing protein [Bacteroidota bacterium]|nr:BatA domain-containing protein [Bacteroidota bacterium]